MFSLASERGYIVVASMNSQRRELTPLVPKHQDQTPISTILFPLGANLCLPESQMPVPQVCLVAQLFSGNVVTRLNALHEGNKSQTCGLIWVGVRKKGNDRLFQQEKRKTTLLFHAHDSFLVNV